VIRLRLCVTSWSLLYNSLPLNLFGWQVLVARDHVWLLIYATTVALVNHAWWFISLSSWTLGLVLRHWRQFLLKLITFMIGHLHSAYHVMSVYFMSLYRSITHTYPHLSFWVLICHIFCFMTVLVSTSPELNRLVVVPLACQVRGTLVIISLRIQPIRITSSLWRMRLMRVMCTLARLLFWARSYNIIIWVLARGKLRIILFSLKLRVFYMWVFGVADVRHTFWLL